MHAIDVDRAAIWSGYRPLNQPFLVVSVASWWVLSDLNAASGLHPDLVRLLPTAASQAYLPFLLFWVLPVLAFGAAQILFYSVDRVVCKLKWRRIDILRQACWSIVRYVVPMLMMATGFDEIFNGDSFGIFWIVGAAPVLALGKMRLDRARGLILHQLNAGELRNRAFTVARKMGVRLRRVCAVPEGKGHLTNAFATTSNSIALTDNLPKYLTRQEVDFVIAHELAHVKDRHGRKMLLVLVLTLSAMIALLFKLPPGMMPFRPLLDMGVILVLVSIFYFFSRHFEYAADRQAVAFTGDPELAIRSLAKLQQPLRIPSEWSRFKEAFSTHPSPIRRAQAIARIGQIPPARALRILQRPDLRERNPGPATHT
jgi:Zn-dependent protease with chaperone function